jgi:hypothetical protein
MRAKPRQNAALRKYFRTNFATVLPEFHLWANAQLHFGIWYTYARLAWELNQFLTVGKTS